MYDMKRKLGNSAGTESREYSIDLGEEARRATKQRGRRRERGN
jgi:hypothetical protein